MSIDDHEIKKVDKPLLKRQRRSSSSNSSNNESIDDDNILKVNDDVWTLSSGHLTKEIAYQTYQRSRNNNFFEWSEMLSESTQVINFNNDMNVQGTKNHVKCGIK